MSNVIWEELIWIEGWMFSHLMKANGSKIPDEEREMDVNGTIIGPMSNDI